MTAQKSHGKQCQNICQITTSPIELIVSCYLVWFTLRVCSIAAFALLGYIDYLWYFITNRLFFFEGLLPPPCLSHSACAVLVNMVLIPSASNTKHMETSAQTSMEEDVLCLILLLQFTETNIK